MSGKKKQSKEIRQYRRGRIKAEFICIISMFALELVILISAVFVGCDHASKTGNCTVPLDAVVTSVSEERVLSQNTMKHGGNYKYITKTTVTVSVMTDGIFKEKTITSDAPYFRKDQKLKIYYDPEDPSVYYIEEQMEKTRETLITLIVIAALWLAACAALTLLFAKHYKKYKNGE